MFSFAVGVVSFAVAAVFAATELSDPQRGSIAKVSAKNFEIRK